MFLAAGEPVTVVHAEYVTDYYGNESEQLDWANAVETVLEPCGVAPRYSSEPVDPNRSPVIIGLTVFLPSGATVSARDRLRVRGDLWEVEGEPGTWISPFTGWYPGVEVALRRVNG